MMPLPGLPALLLRLVAIPGLLLALGAGSAAPLLAAEPHTTLRIACAANFRSTLDKIIARYGEHHPQVRVQVSSGSSGTLFQQIRHGAPYHLFLSADSFYPAELEKLSLGRADSRRTYALGQLWLWHPGVELSSLRELGKLSGLTVAIANPLTAPYGKAAEQVIASLEQRHTQTWRLVKAQNISQAHQFVHSGNAQAGFIAGSQLGSITPEQLTQIPSELFAPLEQQGIVLAQAPDAAEAFFRFMLDAKIQALIARQGYFPAKTLTQGQEELAANKH